MQVDCEVTLTDDDKVAIKDSLMNYSNMTINKIVVSGYGTKDGADMNITFMVYVL